MKHCVNYLLMVLLLGATSCSWFEGDNDNTTSDAEAAKEPTLLYDIDIEGYTITSDTVRTGETVGGILGRFFKHLLILSPDFVGKRRPFSVGISLYFI